MANLALVTDLPLNPTSASQVLNLLGVTLHVENGLIRWVSLAHYLANSHWRSFLACILTLSTSLPTVPLSAQVLPWGHIVLLLTLAVLP